MRIAIIDDHGRPIRVLTDDNSVYEVDPGQWGEGQDYRVRVWMPPKPRIRGIELPPRISIVKPAPAITSVTHPETKRREARRREALRRLGGLSEPKPMPISDDIRLLLDGMRRRPIL